MTWVIWRQHRVEALVVLLVSILIVPVVIITHQDILQIAQERGLNALVYSYNLTFSAWIAIFQLLPLLLGVFVGAPLIAREFEQHTAHFAWTQSITRQHWLAIKLAWIGGLAALVFSLLALLLMYWSQPIRSNLGPWITFDITGASYVAYALFALALGILLGGLLGKILPAMALSIPLFGLTRLAIEGLRAYYLPPLRATWILVGPDPQVKDWVIGQIVADHFGRPVSIPAGFNCREIPDPKSISVSFTCFRDLGYQLTRIFQPADRFWTFQVIETLIFIGLTAGLIAITFWWINRRAG